MAIEQLGESLLSDIRTRNAQAAKKARKQEEKNAIIGLGVNLLGKIGNQVLSDKMTNFLNNEDIFTARAQQKIAAQNSAISLQLKKLYKLQVCLTKIIFQKQCVMSLKLVQKKI